MSELEHSFEILGETVTVITNSNGTTLFVTFGDVVIEESWGDSVFLNGALTGLRGAALAKATDKVMREAAEFAIRNFICNKAQSE